MNRLTEDYLHWLAPQIRDEHDGLNNLQEFWGLLTIMFETQFLHNVANDDNRRMDGLELRTEFCYAQHISMGARRREPLRSFLDKNAPNPPCSFLEVLIGLSRRLAFVQGGSAPYWAWDLLNNLNLHRCSDPLSGNKATKVADILEQCIWRNYSPDGRGGFFPLKNPSDDQRQIELWYQMQAYAIELERR